MNSKSNLNLNNNKNSSTKNIISSFNNIKFKDNKYKDNSVLSLVL